MSMLALPFFTSQKTIGPKKHTQYPLPILVDHIYKQPLENTIDTNNRPSLLERYWEYRQRGLILTIHME